MTWRALVLVPCGTLLLVPACTDDTGATSSDESTSSSTLTSGMQTTTGLSASESDGGGNTSTTSADGSGSSSGSDSGSGSSSESGRSADEGPVSVCGNNVIEGDEVCDLAQLAGQTCVSQGYQGGQLGCNLTCDAYNTLGCFVCGNGVVDIVEDCESVVPDGTTCGTLGFEGGDLACGVDCHWDTSDCSICGDGIQQGDELCDGLDMGGQDCASLGLLGGTLGCTPGCFYDTSGCDITNRIIFASSTMFTGDMGGLAGADAECQALANAAGLPGIYMAWLSTATESPSTRMTPSAQPYVRPDGVQVAPNWAGLVDGSLDAPINVTETGGAVPIGNTTCGGGGFATVWSATNTAGNTAGGSNCSGWTSTAGGSQWGRADQTSGSWTSWCSGGVCTWLSPIYCVQQ
ncbi:MAG: hypothetical protein KC501_13700 [Myxococcales bacterium]|nr:hypothetical protein [Myxococcales bacterium]